MLYIVDKCNLYVARGSPFFKKIHPRGRNCHRSAIDYWPFLPRTTGLKPTPPAIIVKEPAAGQTPLAGKHSSDRFALAGAGMRR